MMEATIKEELAIHIFSAMAARAGYHTIKPRIDTGNDVIIERSEKLPSRGNITSLGNLFAFQLKTTTEKQVLENEGFLTYDLRAKNFDDMIFRKNLLQEGYARVAPLALVLLVLPDDPLNWLKVNLTVKTVTLNGVFYWYYPADDDAFSTKTKTQRIFIPTQNQVDLNFFDYICQTMLKI